MLLWQSVRCSRPPPVPVRSQTAGTQWRGGLRCCGGRWPPGSASPAPGTRRGGGAASPRPTAGQPAWPSPSCASSCSCACACRAHSDRTRTRTRWHSARAGRSSSACSSPARGPRSRSRGAMHLAEASGHPRGSGAAVGCHSPRHRRSLRHCRHRYRPLRLRPSPAPMQPWRAPRPSWSRLWSRSTKVAAPGDPGRRSRRPSCRRWPSRVWLAWASA
mmetsp:Transcript_29860/g.94093  ORF Transcript_29860/g.94093 Transcript_29860/m.94093 type:complete len:217 (-) Transcript_29860:494-1144(-)